MLRPVAALPILFLLACGSNQSIASKEGDDAWRLAESSAKKSDADRASKTRKRVATPKQLCISDRSASGGTVAKIDPNDPKKPKRTKIGPKPGQKQPPKRPRGMRGMGLASGRFDPDDKKLPMYLVPYDKDNDGELNGSERRNMIRDRAGKLFLRLDRNHDSRISVVEARAACRGSAAIYINKFSARDVDHDGALSRYELENAFKHIYGGRSN